MEQLIYQNEKKYEGRLSFDYVDYLSIYAFYFDSGMKLNDSYTTKPDHVLQKSIRYKPYY